ncbi:helix-turn-helix domain-containing protein [Inquilinus sp. NPDC058860]|uniref:helix-turn-helix domain-containing protein n=1 Tax=Inquilinus sp. NPDC058860 TaxID=3346652 RepID=UPI003686A33A
MSTMNNAQSSIGERLRLAIKAGRETYAEFSERTGIPYRTLQNYLRNEREPNAASLAKIREATEVNLNWLLTGEGDDYFGDVLGMEVLLHKLVTIFANDLVEYLMNTKELILTEEDRDFFISYICHCGWFQMDSRIFAFREIEKREPSKREIERELFDAYREYQKQSVLRAKAMDERRRRGAALREEQERPTSD